MWVDVVYGMGVGDVSAGVSAIVMVCIVVVCLYWISLLSSPLHAYFFPRKQYPNGLM